MPIRAAILGTGWGSRVQIPVFRRAGLEIATVWSPTPANAERTAAQWELPSVAATAEQAIERDDVDLVSIVTPPHTHERLALAALAAGKHVLCEKPMALDSGQAGRMVEAAARHGGQLALIDHELRFHPLRRRLRQLLRDGWAGRPLRVEACFQGGGRLDPGWRWNWWSQAERGGGILGAAGSHLIDLLHWLFDGHVTRVWARLATAIESRPDADGESRPVTADEMASLELELAAGPPAHLQLGSITAGPHLHRVRVDGDEGSLLLENETLRGFRPGGRSENLSVPAGANLAPMRSDEWTVGTFHLAQTIARALGGGDRAPLAEAADFTDGLAVQRVLDAARASSRSGGWQAPV